jgi:hypothetical protein
MAVSHHMPNDEGPNKNFMRWQMIEVAYVTKDMRRDPYERITHLGGAGWQRSQPDVVQQIEQGQEDYYILLDGIPAKLIVALSRFGAKYLKTELEVEEPHILPSLPSQAG